MADTNGAQVGVLEKEFREEIRRDVRDARELQRRAGEELSSIKTTIEDIKERLCRLEKSHESIKVKVLKIVVGLAIIGTVLSILAQGAIKKILDVIWH